ncbi:MAG: hypothetical protein COB04_13905 [Gammaproteobacteria bacterium]|nr:MAG: hypothetical protein COB04_13905 [Gammaproteobacteria bacterium]
MKKTIRSAVIVITALSTTSCAHRIHINSAAFTNDTAQQTILLTKCNKSSGPILRKRQLAKGVPKTLNNCQITSVIYKLVSGRPTYEYNGPRTTWSNTDTCAITKSGSEVLLTCGPNSATFALQ